MELWKPAPRAALNAQFGRVFLRALSRDEIDAIESVRSRKAVPHGDPHGERLKHLLPDDRWAVRTASGDLCLVRVPKFATSQKVHLRQMNHYPQFSGIRDTFERPNISAVLGCFKKLGEPGQDSGDTDRKRSKHRSPPADEIAHSVRSTVGILVEEAGLMTFEGMSLTLAEQVHLLREVSAAHQIVPGIPLSRHFDFVQSPEDYDLARSAVDNPDHWNVSYDKHRLCCAIADSVSDTHIHARSADGHTFTIAHSASVCRGGWGETTGPFLTAFFLHRREDGSTEPEFVVPIPILDPDTLFIVESDKERTIYGLIRALVHWAMCAGVAISFIKPLRKAGPGSPGAGDRLDGLLMCGLDTSAVEILGINASWYLCPKQAMLHELRTRDGLHVHEFRVTMPQTSSAWDDAVKEGLRHVVSWIHERSPCLLDPVALLRADLDSGMRVFTRPKPQE